MLTLLAQPDAAAAAAAAAVIVAVWKRMQVWLQKALLAAVGRLLKCLGASCLRQVSSALLP